MTDGFNDDLGQARQQLEELDRLIPKVLGAASLKAVAIMLPVAESLAPRGASGDLARSGSTEEIEPEFTLTGSAAVRFSVFYGLFQEFGTSFHPVQSFMRAAADQTKAEMGKAIRSVIDAAIENNLVTVRSRKG